MIQLQTKISSVKASNLVFLLESISDIKKLDFLKLDTKILTDIKETFSEKKNSKKDYFLGTNQFKNLIILFFVDRKESLIDSLGSYFKSLPKNFTVLSNTPKNEIDLLNLSILRRYNFQNYKTEKQLDTLNFLTTKSEIEKLEERILTLENIILARDLGSMPANELTPEAFVKHVKSYKWKSIKVKVLTPKDIEKKGLGLIHAVGKGSENKPYVIILEKIIDKKLPTYGLVGKGITFDSGGVQVKPGDSMYEMKGDMCGAAAAYGLMKNLDRSTLGVNIVTSIMLAENAISSTSYRPSDILTSYSGKTVDIIHTDAEGRLVLADGVSYLSKNYQIDKMMTIATLTGACMMALGFRYAAVMGDDTTTINSLIKQSNKSYEKYCKLPFDTYFVDKCKSQIADLENLNRGVYAGSTMGGAFLYNFLLNGEKYTHLDIAGTALNSYEEYGVANKGMTGFGVESLSEFFKTF